MKGSRVPGFEGPRVAESNQQKAPNSLQPKWLKDYNRFEDPGIGVM
jgi:hypothetical protein